jgi:hypothetical protein
MSNAHIHLLLDASEDDAELVAECPSCGSIAIDSLTGAWSKRFIACECGVTMEVVAEELRQLRALAIQYQHAIEKLIKTN